MRRTIGGVLVAGVLLVAACDEAEAPSTPTPNPRPETIDRTTDEPVGSAAGGARRRAPPEGTTSGSFYTLRLPPGAARAMSDSPEVIESVYRLDHQAGVSLTVFQPMPQQSDLDAWTDAAERVLEGIPQRHDEIEVGGQPARVAVFPGELRYTLVLDGQGLLFKCFADEPQDEGWMHAHCDETVSSLTFIRAFE
ncbi:MAG: hypothetical protein J0L92_30940 [Deltaproteobacteria bacterium]|nr:hypothetical protein [Deltaproteobacteria bacterium]